MKPHRKGHVLAIVVALYLATWVGGWISHARDLRARVAIGYDRMVQRNQREYAEGEELPIYARVNPDGPFTAVYWCLPLLPGVLLANSDYVIGPLAGRGGYKIVLWYGVGSVELCTFLEWIA